MSKNGAEATLAAMMYTDAISGYDAAIAGHLKVQGVLFP